MVRIGLHLWYLLMATSMRLVGSGWSSMCHPPLKLLLLKLLFVKLLFVTGGLSLTLLLIPWGLWAPLLYRSGVAKIG